MASFSIIIVLSCMLFLLLSVFAIYQKIGAELRDTRTLLTFNVSYPNITEGLIPKLVFRSHPNESIFQPDSTNLVTIRNDTHSISLGNNTETFLVDERLIDGGKSELSFSNGTDNVIVGDGTKSLLISQDNNIDNNHTEISILHGPPFGSYTLIIENMSHSLVIDKKGHYYSCPPYADCMMEEFIPSLTRAINGFFDDNSTEFSIFP